MSNKLRKTGSRLWKVSLVISSLLILMGLYLLISGKTSETRTYYLAFMHGVPFALILLFLSYIFKLFMDAQAEVLDKLNK